jgi:hypothetical protein
MQHLNVWPEEHSNYVNCKKKLTIIMFYINVSQPFFSPVPLDKVFIYEYPLSSLPPPVPQKTFFFYFLRLAK